MSISKGEVFWAEHIQKQREQGLSSRDYAKANGLSKGTLCRWRGILSNHKSNGTDSGMNFLPVRVDQVQHPQPVACTLMFSPSLQVHLESLPASAWLADLFLHLQGSR